VGIPPDGPVGTVDDDGPEGMDGERTTGDRMDGDWGWTGRLVTGLALVLGSIVGRLGGAAPHELISGLG
jgi:hypothetical protein